MNHHSIDVQLRNLMREDLSTFELIEGYQRVFYQLKILPTTDFLYDKLLKAGVLNITSPRAIRTTYTWYLESLRGYSFFNANRLRAELDHTWHTFTDQDIPKAINRGLVRDVALEWEIPKTHIYFVKSGCYHRVREALGLPSSRRENMYS